MQSKPYVKILAGLPFLVLGIFLALKVNPDGLEKYTAVFISIPLAIATFSISFSFLQLQFSPYKALLKSISGRQITFALITLSISLLPLFTLASEPVKQVPQMSALVIPVLGYMLILLFVVVSEETNPEYLLKEKLKPKEVTQFLKNYKQTSNKHAKKLEKLDFSRPEEKPMHDFKDSKYQSIIVKNNPLNFTINLLAIAVKEADHEVFEYAIKYYLKLSFKIEHHKITKSDSDFKFKINDLLVNSFERLVSIISTDADKKELQNRLLENFGWFIKIKATKKLQTENIYLQMIQILNSFAIEILEKGNYDGALYMISLNRQLGQKGISEPLDKTKFDKVMFGENLKFYASGIKRIGQKAIELGNSDFLYRCLEELGYLGITAIKNDHQPVGVRALHSLVQLGREARANDVKCFWEGCLLDSIDHTKERMWWMLSHTASLDDESQKRWIDLFEKAYSRIYGVVVEITFEKKGRDTYFQIKPTEQKHTEGYIKDAYSKDFDYSDFSDTKEFKL